jgi:(R,R)-butanediol dehydrogenase / meso-butanediol dehydrogenase / diacetyl reductase
MQNVKEQTMKVPFVFGPGDLRLCDVASPEPGPGDVLLGVRSAGICGSDLGYVAMGGVTGPTEQPVPLGHELSGVVVAAGADVRSAAVGDRVILNPLINLVGNGGPEGGFSDYLLVRDVAARPGSLLSIPDNISFDAGALIEPLAVAAHAVNRMQVKAGDKVAIFGAGPIGLAAIVVLRHRGITDIVSFDLSAFRRDRAAQLGASVTFDPRDQPPEQALCARHGTARVFRADLPATTHYLEATGAPVLPDIIRMARTGARICVASVQKKPVPVDFQTVLARELEITGTLGYPTELDEVIAMLGNGAIDLEPMISHRFDGADFLTAFDTACQPDRAAKVLVRYSA